MQGHPPHQSGETQLQEDQRPSTGGLEGQTIAGKYRLLRLLGQGGMGAVYEGQNLATLKRVAVKLLLSPELAQHEGMVKRFFREAKASSIVESDHIVTIFDSGSDPETGFPYMVMEFLDGEDLEQVLERTGPVPPLVAAKLTLQATIGLAKAHEGHIVHRDIKPANIFLTKRDAGDYVVKILDFGIAKVKLETFHETSQGLTRTGSMLGTPLYMSPEQAKGAASADVRSDVWSLGIVLYELLTGRLPYGEASSLGELMVSILTEDIPLVQDLAPWVPPELAEVCHRAVSRNIERRFQSAAEFRDALFAILPDGPTLMPDELQSLPHEQRAWVAPRLQLTDDGMLRATARTGLSMTQSQPGLDEVPKKSSGPLVAVAAVAMGVLVLGGGSLVAWRTLGAKPEAEAATVKTVVVEKEKDAPPAEEHSYALKVKAPDDAVVLVAGKVVEPEEGSVQITGPIGRAVPVKVKAGDESVERSVAITDSGLLPDEIELVVKKNGARKAVAATGGQKPGRPLVDKLRKRVADAKKAAAPPEPKPKPKPKSQISTDTSEFN